MKPDKVLGPVESPLAVFIHSDYGIPYPSLNRASVLESSAARVPRCLRAHMTKMTARAGLELMVRPAQKSAAPTVELRDSDGGICDKTRWYPSQFFG